ncbi:Uncharacterised protein [Mycobacteroides abscessus subsp. abscessus]|nr:Uncharacterised protein [Mycobacteroides abscessus subsp. abscessus]
MGRVDDLDRVLLSHEHVDQVRLRVDMEVVLRLVDEQDRRALGTVNPQEGNQRDEHAQASTAFIEDGDVGPALHEFDAELVAVELEVNS